MTHALLAPSSMDRIISCFASLAESDGKVDKGSRHAHEGTAAHSVHSWALEKAQPAIQWLGEDIDVEEDDEIVATFECDEEMAANVQISLDLIYGYMELDPLAELYVEQRVDFSHVTGHPSSFGTSDVIIIMPTLKMIYVVDFKYGKGVKVDAWDWHAEGATPNAQMASYGLGALKLFEHYNFDKITLVIHQPRINHVSDHTMDVRDLEMWGRNAMARGTRRAVLVLEAARRGERPSADNYEPNNDNCKFCKGKVNCPAIQREIQTALDSDFDDIDATKPELDDKPFPLALPEDEFLDSIYPKLSMMEDWISAVYRRIQARALAGVEFTTCYLKKGRKGNREFIDKDRAERDLKAMRFKDDVIFKRKLISPAQVEEMLKGQPKRWKTMLKNITQKEGGFALEDIGVKGERYVITSGLTDDDFDDLDVDGADDLA